MARRSSLGPFPKTHRWREIVGRCGVAPERADELIEQIRRRMEQLIDDEQALSATIFFAALPVVTREHDPVQALKERFGIRYQGSLQETLEELLGPESPSKRAALETYDRFTCSARFNQLSVEEDREWLPWRDLDGSAFCDLGRLFFACLTEQHLLYYLEAAGLKPEEVVIRQHAWELSLITRSFTARWFNACAMDQIPSRGSIRWYLGHCLGKVDMELERELSTHVEPLPNPFRRKKVPPPSLGLPL